LKRIYIGSVVYSRWLEPSGWQITKSAYFSSLPAALKRLVPWLVRRNTLKALYGQGISRHTREEVYALGIADLGAIQQRLATQPFLLGETASSIDACAYAFIANILYAPIKNPLQDYTRQHTCFELYCQRMHDLYFL
jgi:glutathione S-transferase